jgi:hypothetical protein
VEQDIIAHAPQSQHLGEFKSILGNIVRPYLLRGNSADGKGKV